MKNFFYLGLFVLGFYWTSAQSQFQYTIYKNDPAGLRLYTLDNGLTVYLAQNKDEPKIQTYIAIRAGSTYDPSDRTGLAHYLEHMLFKGTHKIGAIDWFEEKPYLEEISQLYEDHKNEQDPEKKKAIYKKIDSVSYEASKRCIANDYDKMLTSLGAEGTNAHTWFEETIYKNKIPSNQLKRWLDIESERFSTLVLRLFHTELEAVYEEYNRSLDNDNEQAYDLLLQNLFPNHPYGQQTTIGTSFDLKNPSMVAIHKYFDTYYVPNNMAIILVGDIEFEPTIEMINATFGKYKSKPVSHPVLPKEAPLTKNIQKTISGPSAENMMMAYRFNGIKSEDAKMVTLIDMILSNSSAGLIDLNINQQQKTLGSGCYPYFMNDYGVHEFYGSPKEGQSLQEVQNLLLEQIEKVKNGEFEDWIIPAVINDLKFSKINQFDNSTSTASIMYQAFIHQQDWQSIIDFLPSLESITKEQIVDFAKKNYQNYVSVYKEVGENKNLVKVENPGITPIETNRGEISEFAKNIYEMPVSPLSPKYIDFKTEMNNASLGSLPIKTITNKNNDLFFMYYVLDIGEENDKKLPLAIDYLNYLGTDTMSPEEVKKEFYKLGVSYGVSVQNNRSYVYLNGIVENLEPALALFENLISNVHPDAQVYQNMVSNILKEREDNTKQKSYIFWNGLLRKSLYGDDSPQLTRLSKEELQSVDPNALCEMIKQLRNYPHEILYYGKNTENIKPLIAKIHTYPASWKKIPPRVKPKFNNFDNKVYFYDYDMVQTEFAFVAKDDVFKMDDIPYARVFNEYFGSGLSSIVFQEIRESKSLAYSAFSTYRLASEKGDNNLLYAYIGTQSNKLPQAVDAMIELLTELPESLDQFEGAKSAALKKIQSQRITKQNIFFTYYDYMDLGLDYDYRQQVYDAIEKMTFADLQKFYDEKIKGQNFNYIVMGNEKDIDFKALEKLGKVEKQTLSQLFN